MADWVAQFLFERSDGSTGVAHVQVSAPTRDEACAKAMAGAPRDREFVMSIHARSEDQMLGSVRHRARILAGQSQRHGSDDPDEP